MAALRAGEGGGDPRSRRSEAEALAEVNERLKETIASDTERLRLIREQTEARRLLESAVDTVDRFEQERALLDAQLRLMQNGVEVSVARQAAEDGVLLAMVAQAAAAENLTPEVRAQLEAFGRTLRVVRDTEAEIERLTAEAKNVAPAFYGAANAVEAMNARLDSTLAKLRGILSAIGNIGFDVVAARAETAALQAGATRAEAAIEGQYAADIAGGPQTGLAGLANRLAAGATRVARQELLRAQEERDAAIAAATPSGGSPSGGGAAPTGPNALQHLEPRRHGDVNC
jgi:chromosome segregation ATPase